ncbi:solute carrier family 22 member 15-like [Lingula anatina]|uniref:Solute carrier family 22 member 15-like n=1 Tax=Lingula anatina TaxID=7574 RepID=A0A1S3GZL2_LINAN|nr:solute carrier family 22 member 15-like [Lingula anatina]|eukprot:XP_013378671.1 solute carrier family 22 member 15-like [Lingula anatina]
MSEGFERILKDIGSFGRKQIEVFVIVNLCDLMTGWTILIPIFIGAQPHWECPALNNTVPWSEWSNTTTVPDWDQGNKSMSRVDACTPDNGVCQGIKYTSEFTSIVTEWNLVCALDEISDIVTTIQMAGIFFGALVISQLSDAFGRKPVWFATMTVNSIVGFCNAFAPRWEIYAAMRFFNGMCAGGLLIVSYVWPIEFVGAKWRVVNGAVGFWQVGNMLLALLAYFIRDWKTLVMVTTPIPTVLVWFLWRFLPESPRWLAMHGKEQEAEKVLELIARVNKKPTPNFEAFRKYLEDEKRKGTTTGKYSYWDLFRTPLLTRHTLVLMFAWFVYGATYYGLSLNVKHLPGDIYLNAVLLSSVEVPALAFVVIFSNKLGRRLTMFVTMLIGGLATFSVLFIGLAGKLEELGTVVTVLAMVGKLGVTSAWNVGYIYTAELFPTVIRSIGSGAASMAGRIGGVVAPQFTYLDKVSKELPFIVFGVLGLAAAFLGLTLPETKDHHLPDNVPEWTWCRKGKNKEDSRVEISIVGHTPGRSQSTVTLVRAASIDENMDVGLSMDDVVKE